MAMEAANAECFCASWPGEGLGGGRGPVPARLGVSIADEPQIEGLPRFRE